MTGRRRAVLVARAVFRETVQRLQQHFDVEDNPGDWLYHCHVAMHMMGGMIGRYTVSS